MSNDAISHEEKVIINNELWAKVNIDHLMAKIYFFKGEGVSQTHVGTYTCTPKHIVPKKGEPGYDPWYIDSEEKESCTGIVDKNMLNKRKEMFSNAKKMLYTFRKRVDEQVKNGTFDSPGDISLSGLRIRGYEAEKLANEAEVEERKIYGGMTWQEYHDEM